MKRIPNFLKWLDKRVIINIRNEENFALKRSISLSYARLLMICTAAFFTFYLVNTYLIAGVVSKWFNSEDQERRNKKQIVKLTLKMDSLMQEIKNRDLFLASLKDLVNGGDGTLSNVKPVDKNDTIQNENINLNAIEPADSILRLEYENINHNEDHDYSDKWIEVLKNKPIYSSNVIKPFSITNKNFGTIYNLPFQSSVLSMGKGRICSIQGSEDVGFTMVVSYGSVFVIYKNLYSILKHEGDFVHELEVIGLSSTILEIQTWVNGYPIDIEKLYIL